MTFAVEATEAMVVVMEERATETQISQEFVHETYTASERFGYATILANAAAQLDTERPGAGGHPPLAGGDGDRLHTD